MALSARTLLLPGALALLLGGCYQLDPFLYQAHPTGPYVFDPHGSTELTTVDAGQIEPVSFKTADGLTLAGVYVKATLQPPRAYVLYFHGNGGLVSEFRYAKRLSNLGYDVLAYDYRGWGRSDAVTPTEQGLLEDGRAARAWLAQRAGSASSVLYYGLSFGGAVATQAAVDTPPQALVLESTFASIEAFKTDSTQMDFSARYVAKDSWNTAGRIGQVHVPVLILAGLSDDYVRPEFSQQIYRNANEPKELVLVEGGTHAEVPEAMGPSYAATLQGFVNTYVPSP